jgi:hypothetical protein
MLSELLALVALVALAGMAGTIGFAVALMLRRDAPTQTPPPAAERNLTESFYLEQRLQRLESGHNISININMPQVRYSAAAPEQQQLPEVRTPLYLPAVQTRQSLPDSKVQVIDWSTANEYATIR